MSNRDDDANRNPDLKCFVGGISWQMNDQDLRDAFKDYACTDAQVIIDKMTQKARGVFILNKPGTARHRVFTPLSEFAGFGFVWFRDKLSMEDACRDMHEKELNGRKISCTKAVPMVRSARTYI